MVIVAGPLGVGKTSTMNLLLDDSVLRVRAVDECVQKSQTYASHFTSLFQRDADRKEYDSLYHHVRAVECDDEFMDNFELSFGHDFAYETTGSQIPLWSTEIASSRGYKIDLIYVLTGHEEALRRVAEREKQMLDVYTRSAPEHVPRLVHRNAFDAVYAASVRTCFEIIANVSVLKLFASVKVYDNEDELKLVYSTLSDSSTSKVKEFLSRLNNTMS